MKNARARVLFYKENRKPPFDTNRYTPTVAQLRAIADSTYAFSVYGRELGIYIKRTYYAKPPGPNIRDLPLPWPKRPPLPKLLR
jgi:hypothetical protein